MLRRAPHRRRKASPVREFSEPLVRVNLAAQSTTRAGDFCDETVGPLGHPLRRVRGPDGVLRWEPAPRVEMRRFHVVTYAPGRAA